MISLMSDTPYFEIIARDSINRTHTKDDFHDIEQEISRR